MTCPKLLATKWRSQDLAQVSPSSVLFALTRGFQIYETL